MQKKMLQPASTPLSKLPASRIIWIHIISQLTPQPPLPHTPPEDIPSLVGGVFHMLAEGSPQWSFYRWGLSHIPYVQKLHISTEIKTRISGEFVHHVDGIHLACRVSVWQKSSAKWARRRRESRQGADTWCKKSACNLWNTPVLSLPTPPSESCVYVCACVWR